MSHAIKGRTARSAKLPRMRRWIVLLPTLVLATACGRNAAPPLAEYRDGQSGFTVRRPAEWVKVSDDASAVRFVPPPWAGAAEDTAEFIAVFTMPSAEQLNDQEIRRQVFTKLPVQGVSGFQRDARTTKELLWYKFEVTGTSGGVEWASVGVVVAGAAGFQIAVCAKPITVWRTGQKQCDEVIRTFKPGNLQ